jgi:aspartate-semialdehyde dehydrogenase
MERQERMYRAGVLGATGMVGQRIVRLLEGHPWFRLQAVAGSGRSAGRKYGEAVRWAGPGEPPPDAAAMKVRPCTPGEMDDCDVIFTSLGSEIARGIEGSFVEAGHAVVSNSSAYRLDANVPLIIPEVNPDHLSLLEDRGDNGGFIVTNPNCSVIGLAMVTAPLHRAFGVRRMVVATLQALSGAGMEGPRGIDILDNVLPFIPGEEEKIGSELSKLLGRTGQPREIAVSAHCHRVAVQDGHLEAVSLELDRPVSPEEVAEILGAWRGEIAEEELPSAPPRPLEVRTEPDRPQPRIDRYTGGGMTVVVGRIRDCPVFTVRLELLFHNTVRGAAGAALLNGELLASRGYLRPRRNEGERH